MDDKESLIALLEKAHQSTRELMEMVDPDQEIYPGWTIKQFLAHLAGWDDACVIACKAYERGDVPAVAAPRGSDVYNAQTVAEREALSLKQIINEYEQARSQWIELVREMKPEMLAGIMPAPWGQTLTVADLIKGMAGHELEHTYEIRQHLKSKINHK